MYSFVKVIVCVLALCVTGLFTALIIQNNRLSEKLKQSTAMSQNLKQEVTRFSGQVETFSEKIAAADERTSVQSRELDQFKKSRQELVDRMLQLEKQKAELEKVVAEKDSKLKEMEERVLSGESLDKDFKTTQALLAKAKKQLETLQRRVPGDAATATDREEELREKLREKQHEYVMTGFKNPALKKDLADLRYNLAFLLADKKNYAGAIREYESVLALNPADADAHYNTAVLYEEKLGDFDKAQRHYEDYLRLSPFAADADKVREWISNRGQGRKKAA